MEHDTEFCALSREEKEKRSKTTKMRKKREAGLCKKIESETRDECCHSCITRLPGPSQRADKTAEKAKK